MAQMLALARKIPAADASMKQGKWDKKSFLGEEVRGKVLGLAGLGRIGQEVARRARAFEMTVIAHDPFISAQVARDLGIELVSLDELCARADFLSLHMPSTPRDAAHLQRRAARRRASGPAHHQHRARRPDRRDGAGRRDSSRADRRRRPRRVPARSRRRITRCRSCRRSSPPRTSPPRRARARNWSASRPRPRCATFSRPASSATRSTFPSVAPDEFQRLQPFMRTRRAARLSRSGRWARRASKASSVRYYGELAGGRTR